MAPGRGRTPLAKRVAGRCQERLKGAALEVIRLDAHSEGDFWKMHCDANGTGWCFCVAWWVPTWEGWGERSADANRRLRAGLFDRGEFDGYLLISDAMPVAWCQVGPRDRLTKLCDQYKLSESPGTWALTCITVVPSQRGKGLGHRLLAGVLADLPQRGARRVEAFPRSGKELPDDDVWTGPESLYLRQGFAKVGGTTDWPVLAHDLAPLEHA